MDRKGYIGGSDAAAILGLSPWRTALDLYHEKVGDAPREPVLEARRKVLERGKRLEPYVIDMLTEDQGLTMAARNIRLKDSEHPFLACELDAVTADDRNVEIKTVSPFNARDWGEQQTDEIPVYYTAQVMHGLMISNREETIVAALIGADDFRVYRVNRDDETIAALRAREVAFWRDHIEAGVPPDPATGEDVSRWFAPKAGKSVNADTALIRAYNDLREYRAQSKALDERIEAAEEQIKLAMRDAEALMVDGKPAVTWKSQARNAFDQSAFKAAHPDLWEAFKRQSQTRVFRIK